MEAYEQAVSSGVPLLGIGLCSTEVGNPASRFREVFARAQADGLHTVAHAGEEGDASYVTDVLDNLHVERVDHGYGPWGILSWSIGSWPSRSR